MQRSGSPVFATGRRSSAFIAGIGKYNGDRKLDLGFSASSFRRMANRVKVDGAATSYVPNGFDLSDKSTGFLQKDQDARKHLFPFYSRKIILGNV